MQLLKTKGGRVPDDCATFEHLDDKFSPMRGTYEVERVVLACYKCNWERGKANHDAQPRHVLMMRSINGRGRPFADLLKGVKEGIKKRAKK